MEKFSDQELIEAIRKGGPNRQKAIRTIYGMKDLKQKVIQFVQQNSGNFQDGQDMFHEGLIVLDRNIRQGKFRGDSTLSLYLYSICRFLWMNQIRKKAKVDLEEDNAKMDTPVVETPEVELMSTQRKEMLQRLLTQLGERCKKILEMWQLSYSMDEIAEKMELSSAKMARKSKYRCQQSLIKIIKDNPEWESWIR